jgi:hypothetical protein
MPNIEIVGVIPKGSDDQIIRKIIKCHLSKEELKNVVFTLHQASVEDIDGCDAPYVRISDTDKKRAKKIAKLLNNIIDVETLILTEFIPKKIILDKTRPL